eukprot:6419669-Alexandrium_andersonii.AAC.1
MAEPDPVCEDPPPLLAASGRRRMPDPELHAGKRLNMSARKSACRHKSGQAVTRATCLSYRPSSR